MTTEILSKRYASKKVQNLWSASHRIILEREFWLSVLEFQKKLGLAISADIIKRYKKVVNKIDFESISVREKSSKHDIHAKMSEFNELAQADKIHLGMTSRDLSENVDLILIKKNLEIVNQKCFELLLLFIVKLEEFKRLKIIGRTHNKPAQITTFGRRLAMFCEEFIFSIDNLHDVMGRLPFRGIKGAIGTEFDQRNLLGDLKRVEILNKLLLKRWDFKNCMSTPGQIYPRSIDFEISSAILQLAAPLSNLALTIRLMAGLELLNEEFEIAQVGSSVMPHKQNPRTSERINSLMIILRAQTFALSELAGNQWNEGDVSCSATRRITIPQLFMAFDGLIEASFNVLSKMKVNQQEIADEVNKHNLISGSTLLIDILIKHGLEKSKAYTLVKKITLQHSFSFKSNDLDKIFEFLNSEIDKPLKDLDKKFFLEKINDVSHVEYQINKTLKVAKLKIQKMKLKNLNSFSPII